VTWTFTDTTLGRIDVVVAIPKFASKELKLPVLITMHGRGEAQKGSQRGARGWLDDYKLARAVRRIHQPPLTRQDLLNFVTAERLGAINQSLATRAYGGLIVVCPYTPLKLAGNQPLSAFRPYGKFIVEQLLPRVYGETPALGTPASTGIDGVSLGGRAALVVGFNHPKAFGAIGTLQAAFYPSEIPELTGLAKAAVARNPQLQIRLLSSQRDFYLKANRALSRALKRAGVAYRLFVAVGPHDYPFNRGPGAFEMLLFHDRALRGEPHL